MHIAPFLTKSTLQLQLTFQYRIHTDCHIFTLLSTASCHCLLWCPMSGVPKGFADRPRDAATGYFGHGMCIETLPAGNNSDLLRLQEKNIILKEQLQYAQQLLDTWQQQPCSSCQLHASATNRLPNSRTKSRTSSSTKNAEESIAAPSIAGSSSAVQDSIGKAFRQQQVLVAQLQRQVLVLQTELSSRDALILEADAVLAEASRRLAPLLALQTTVTQSSTATSTRQHHSAAVRAQTTSNPATRQTAAAGGSAEGAVAGSRYPTTAVKNQVIDQAGELFAWCRSSMARIDRARAQSAAQCRTARGSCANANSAIGAAGASSSPWESESQGPSTLQQLQMQYKPAGGNQFMRCGAALTLPGIAAGTGTTAFSTAALFQLIPQLASLAQSLASLSVQLKTIVLPALPWVRAAAIDQQLISSTEATAGAAAATAGQLVEACSLLPAVAGNLNTAAAAVTRRKHVQQAGVASQAGSWHNAEEPVDDAGDVAVEQSLGLDQTVFKKFDELAALLSRPGLAAKGGRSSGGTAASRESSIGRSSGQQPHEQHQQRKVAFHQQLDDLRHHCRVLAFKKLALEQQLGFVAKCSAEQAKLVSRLTQDVATALATALDEAEIQDDMHKRRLNALRLIQQLQRLMLLVQQRPGDVGGSAVRTLMSLLQQHGEVLDDLPHLLNASSAPVLKASALAAVTSAFEDFRTSMHNAQKDVYKSCRRLKAVNLTDSDDRACG